MSRLTDIYDSSSEDWPEDKKVAGQKLEQRVRNLEKGHRNREIQLQAPRNNIIIAQRKHRDLNLEFAGFERN